MFKTELCDEIIYPLINKLKMQSKEEQIEVMSMLDVHAGVKILFTVNDILSNTYDRELMNLSSTSYNVLLKRLNKMLMNKKISCSIEDKKHIDNLYTTLMDNRPMGRNKSKKRKK